MFQKDADPEHEKNLRIGRWVSIFATSLVAGALTFAFLNRSKAEEMPKVAPEVSSNIVLSAPTVPKNLKLEQN